MWHVASVYRGNIEMNFIGRSTSSGSPKFEIPGPVTVKRVGEWDFGIFGLDRTGFLVVRCMVFVEG